MYRRKTSGEIRGRRQSPYRKEQQLLLSLGWSQEFSVNFSIIHAAVGFG